MAIVPPYPMMGLPPALQTALQPNPINLNPVPQAATATSPIVERKPDGGGSGIWGVIQKALPWLLAYMGESHNPGSGGRFLGGYMQGQQTQRQWNADEAERRRKAQQDADDLAWEKSKFEKDLDYKNRELAALGGWREAQKEMAGDKITNARILAIIAAQGKDRASLMGLVKDAVLEYGYDHPYTQELQRRLDAMPAAPPLPGSTAGQPAAMAPVPSVAPSALKPPAMPSFMESIPLLQKYTQTSSPVSAAPVAPAGPVPASVGSKAWERTQRGNKTKAETVEAESDARVAVGTEGERIRKPGLDNRKTEAQTQDIKDDNDRENRKLSQDLDIQLKRIGIQTAGLSLRQKQYELNLYKATHPMPKPPKPPTQTEINAKDKAQARQYGLSTDELRDLRSLGVKPGPQTSEFLDFWEGQGAILRDDKSIRKNPAAPADVMKRFKTDVTYWNNGRYKYGGPGKRIDTWSGGKVEGPGAKTGNRNVDSLE